MSAVAQSSSPEPNGPRDVVLRVKQFLRAVDEALAAAGVQSDERRAVVQDLGAQVFEMLAERVNGGDPTVADVDAVLAQLDPPAAYGAWAEHDDTDDGPPRPTAPAAPPHPPHPQPPRGVPPVPPVPPVPRHPIGPSRRSFDLPGIMNRVLGGDWPHVQRFTDRARHVRRLAEEEAIRLRHTYVGTEHVLIGLARDEGGLAARILEGHGIGVARARALVEELVRPDPNFRIGGGRPPRHAPTSRVKKAVDRARDVARELRHDYVGTEHLLIGLLDVPDGLAAVILREQGVTRAAVVAEVVGAPRGDAPAAGAASADPFVNRPIGRVLTQMGKITREQVVEALAVQKSKGGPLGGILIRLGYITVQDLMSALSAQKGNGPAGPQPATPAAAPAVRPRPMGMNVWPAGSGRSVAIAGAVFTVVATGDDTGGAYAVFQLALPPGGTLPALRDLARDWSLVVQTGEVRLDVGGRTATAAGGAFIAVPKGTSRALHNAGASIARATLIARPPGLEQFVYAAGVPAPPDEDPPAWGPEQERHIREVGAPLGIVFDG